MADEIEENNNDDEEEKVEKVVMRSEYPSNSFKSRKQALLLPEKRAITKVTKGNVTKKKKSLSESFAELVYSDETRNVGQYILFDVLIPAFKDTISQMITTGIEMILYGESNRRPIRREGSRSYVSYNSFSREKTREQVRRENTRNHFRQQFSDVVLDTRADAEEVLSNMVDLIEEYGICTVADFYDLVGLSGEWADNKYGWDNLSQAFVKRVRLGYVLMLPRAMTLD